MFHDISAQMQQVMRALEEQLQRDQRSLRSVASGCCALPLAAGNVGAAGRLSRTWQQRRLLKSVAFAGRAREEV